VVTFRFNEIIKGNIYALLLL